MQDKKIEIGKRIKLRREELNLTQEDLGNVLFLNKSTIQRYENGKVERIKIPVLHAMAKALNVDPKWLALKTNEMGSFSENFNFADENDINESVAAQNEDEQRILLLARHLEKFPKDKREKIINNFENTIDIYLDAMGLNDKEE